MSYCINPKCRQRSNPSNLEFCQACGTPLLIQNRYRLISPLRRLDRPGNSELFEVEDIHCSLEGEKYKVIKIIKKNNPTLVRLFKQEAEVLKTINHPGIPRVEGSDSYFTISIAGYRHELHCLVMEKIAGENLENWVKINGKITEELALDWLKQLLSILAYLHENKYFHRDLKPSNIMISPEGQLVLIDFGTVRQITETFLISLGMRNEEPGTGIVSPSYTAPEQVNGRGVPQSDLYSLGRTFIYLLTGFQPFELEEEPKTGRLIWRKYAPQISPVLADWVDYLMAPFPWQRPPNVSFVLNYLEATLSPPPIKKRAPRWLIVLNFALFSLLIITGVLWLQNYSENRPPESSINN